MFRLPPRCSAVTSAASIPSSAPSSACSTAIPCDGGTTAWISLGVDALIGIALLRSASSSRSLRRIVVGVFLLGAAAFGAGGLVRPRAGGPRHSRCPRADVPHLLELVPDLLVGAIELLSILLGQRREVRLSLFIDQVGQISQRALLFRRAHALPEA